jgi:hypothetical protein
VAGMIGCPRPDDGGVPAWAIATSATIANFIMEIKIYNYK